jgi:hypothetical protein
MSLDLALAVFPHIEGADHAYADVLDAVGDVPWVHEIALVEHHRRDRLVIRGTFAGRYVDAMAAAFEDRGGQLVRRHLSPEAARALEAAVAGRPLAAG